MMANTKKASRGIGLLLAGITLDNQETVAICRLNSIEEEHSGCRRRDYPCARSEKFYD